ncbi:glycosyltransferase family 4 protein [Microbulbifer guangxiensis]|uniref:glycosyltransferase family 4 protein n=1 Tax=Microbulbifer guangxiensis TaxID=2904249 RepID=UPI001F43CD2E|nr:glycosyltransferase family 4 protein [Microbulbifer guangxiensis]
MNRILVVSHGHPDFNKGGAEVAAYNLFKELRRHCHDAYFLARTELLPHGGAAFSQRKDSREILFHTKMDDGFLFSSLKTKHLWGDLRELLLKIKPDVVHFHHYFQIGIEAIEVVRKTLPNTRIILTLHEYLAICHNNGLMYKTNDKLCYQYTPRDCNNCFPDKSPGDFFLREQYFKNIFRRVDHFVSPSRFLKNRYVDWGVSEKAISVIENGQPKPEGIIARENSVERSSSGKIKLAFFGQVNPYKGIDVLLSAIASLGKKYRERLVVEIHGANFNNQRGEYQEKIKRLLRRTRDVVTFCGSYESHELPRLLSGTDWVVIPSIWWENSPMVIQEAFTARVPIITSDIGGMAEKIKDEVDGLHFRAGKHQDLAEVIVRIIEDSTLRGKLVDNIAPPLTIEECLNQHIKIYGIKYHAVQKQEASEIA